MNNEHLYNYIQKIKLSEIQDIHTQVLQLKVRLESIELLVGFLSVLVLCQFIYIIARRKK